MKHLWKTTAIAAALVVLGLAAYAYACDPHWAHWCRVRYDSVGDNTMALLDCGCTGDSDTWYVSFFHGDQPTLWEFAEIQNTASDLIR